MVGQEQLSEEMWFFIYLLEHYAEHKRISTGEALRSRDDAGITDEIFDGYFQYHQERIENAYEDIESLLATGSHSYKLMGFPLDGGDE